ncbi:MAG: sulfurtransferase TusA family protein [Candidatus Hydrothermarchaeales archaeon]
MNDEPDILDLHGEKCPDTFVYTKIKLEEMAYEGGGLLKVLIDFPEAAENIPRSLRDEKIDYQVLEVKHIGGKEYELLIRAPPIKE